MTNIIAPIFLDLAARELTIIDEETEVHHNKACKCAGKCRVCRCKEKKGSVGQS